MSKYPAICDLAKNIVRAVKYWAAIRAWGAVWGGEKSVTILYNGIGNLKECQHRFDDMKISTFFISYIIFHWVVL